LIEDSFGRFDYLAASDECGRGPLAGPVVACSVGMSQEFFVNYSEKLIEIGVKDSKKITSLKIEKIIQSLGLPRNALKNFKGRKRIQSHNFDKLDIGLSLKSNSYIDDNNILVASLEAMKSSFSYLENLNLDQQQVFWLIDGPHAPKTKNRQNLIIKPIIKGDSKSVLIGLASIIAKYYRDKLMEKMDDVYPGYGLAKHKGYPTKIHLEAIRKLGPSEVHRKSFRGVIV